MAYLGDIAEDATITFEFTSRTLATGVPIVLAGTPALSVYKDDNTTQSTAGITLTVSHDSVVGKNNVKIDTSADAFYATGSDYSVVITTGTVDGNSVVGEVVGTFSIENRSLSGAAPSAAAVADAVWDEALSGHVAAGSYGKAVADIETDATAILLDTGTTLPATLATIDGVVDAILLDTGTDGVVLANNSITSSVVATNAFSNSAFTTGFWNAVNAEADTALADYDGPTNTEMVAAFTEIKGATWATTDTLEALRDRGDAAWITADVSSLATAAALTTVDTVVDAIKAKTDSLTFTVAGEVDSNIKSVAGTTVTGAGTEGDPWGP